MTDVNTAAAPDSEKTEGGGEKTDTSSPPSSPTLHGGSKVYKSGPLFLSSKGIGWTSWKKRWFVLTETSLVFYRSDPNVAPQKGAEVNVTLGGIDLNSSGSVVVKEDKKLITVSFADGRDGRTFTLKAETSEDLQEWKAALEEALSNAPDAAAVTGQSGALKHDQSTADDASPEESKDKQAVKSMVLGRPILLALEDTDGTPSFLEKALRFIEDHGVKTEGILRQAADVELVERRIQEFEKGKTEFSPDEDAHVIADCVKYVLRELPSSPVPASCCKALLDAYRTDPSVRINAMRSAICETFPEPNRRLLQRIVSMMEIVASNKTVNRMGVSAVAACMAPLLLRPLLAGECEIDHDVNMGVDSSAQLLQAAAAANHAQAICVTLLEECDNIFGDGALTHEPYTDSEESVSDSEEITDDESYEEDEDEDEEEEGSDYDATEDVQESSSSCSEIDENQYNNKDSESSSSEGASPQIDGNHESNQTLPRQPQTPLRPTVAGGNAIDLSDLGDDPAESSLVQASSELSRGSGSKRPTVWGRAPGRKNLSMECIEGPFGEEVEGQKLDLNAVKSLLQDCIEAQKHDLNEQRANLEENVAKLQEQLKKETLRTALEAGLKDLQPLSVQSLINEKMTAELDEIAQLAADIMNLKKKAEDLELQLNQQRDQKSDVGLDFLELHLIDQQKLKGEQMDGRALSSSSSTCRSFSRSKNESNLDKPAEKHKKPDRSPSLNIPLPQNPQNDASQILKGTSSFARARMGEVGGHKPPGSVSRKSSTKEGTSTSAFSKLTNRLNFLKERRTQMASELQNLEKSQNTTQSENLEQGTGSEPSQSIENPDKHQESKGQSSEKGHDPESHELHPNPSIQTPQNNDKGRKSGGGRGLERGKSTSHSMKDKGLTRFTPKPFSK